tara:strand:- start:3903 stop:4376 length:474 start_codon:yes stop_codon:yes gene_type:complete
MKKSELKTIIQSILRELKEELNEMNVTANVDGYQTPYAFSDSESEEEHKKNMKSRAEVFDYTTSDEEKKNTVSLNEGKSLFHIFRDHPDFSPEQKVGVTIREINKLLTEVEKLIKVSAKYKTESNIHNKKLWKTTNRYLNKLEEKIGKISLKIKEMR